MANILSNQITEEGPRNAVVKLTGTLDTADVSEVSVIAPSMFSNNDRGMVLVGFRLDLVEYSISTGLEIILAWNASSPQPILPLAGRGRIDSHNYGGLLPNMLATGYDGSINLNSQGFVAGTKATFSVLLELVKLYRV